MPWQDTPAIQTSETPLLFSGDPTLAFGSDLRVRVWNGAAERLTGRPAQEVVGSVCWEALGAVNALGGVVCHPDCSIALACQQARPVETTAVLVPVQGRHRPVHLSTLTFACGSETLFVHVLHDTASVPVPPRAARSALTARQRDVLALLAEGLDTRGIAARLTLSPATVRNHVRAILVAVGCHSRLEAVVEARRRGLI